MENPEHRVPSRLAAWVWSKDNCVASSRQSLKSAIVAASSKMSAASKAIDKAGFLLVASGPTRCITHPEESAAEGYPVEVVLKRFMKLA